MSILPRIAVGTIQAGADPTAVLWGLMDALAHSGLRVQSFLSQAYFAARDGATAITGLAPRHLDSWLMSRESCVDVFRRGTATSDFALVEGSFVPGREVNGLGSDFETICSWLNLPRLAVIDARLLTACQLPNRPRELDGLILDRVQDTAELCRLQTLFEALWNVPVVGWLSQSESLRQRIACVPIGRRPGPELCHALGERFARGLPLQKILSRAERNFCELARPKCRARVCRTTEKISLRVAVAFDDAFGGYFPDALEQLEARGATLCDFSPLRDERLPAATDVVYVGCGHPEIYARELAANDCMMLALKSHLCGGRRIYAECGGLAYLCQHIELPDGQLLPMTGLLPTVARLNESFMPPQPSEVILASDTWLGESSEHLRGYLNQRWSLAPHAAIDACGSETGHELDVVRRQQTIGSRLHLNFALQPAIMERFFAPCEVRPPARCAAAIAAPPRRML